jgi:hypothetical protein
VTKNLIIINDIRVCISIRKQKISEVQFLLAIRLKIHYNNIVEIYSQL